MPCSLITNHDRRPLDLSKHRSLHPEGGRLISSWFSKAWSQRKDEDSVFESFIFAWFSFNAWAACVTGKDRDSEYIKVSVQQSHLEIGSEVLQDCVHKFDCGHNAQYFRQPKIFNPTNPSQIFA
jgi:hypothetical protein